MGREVTFNPYSVCNMNQIKFEKRAVAFIDVLGFKALVVDALSHEESRQRLESLVQLLSTAVPRLDAEVNRDVAQHLIPKHLYISDCLILSAPLRDSRRADYCGLSTIVMRTIQLSHFFLDAGHLFRGGISVGNVWHSDSNIVGPAYQEAYCLAEHEVKEPIVALTEEAVRYWRGGSRMCLNLKGRVFVNGLFDFYIPTVHGSIDAAYRKYDQNAKHALQLDISESAKSKWRWFREFLADEKRESKIWDLA